MKIPASSCLALGLALASLLPARGNELSELIQLALTNSPMLRAAQEGSHQAAAARDASGEFFDPNTTAAAGRLSGTAATPLLSSPVGLPSADAYGAAAAVEVPVRPGLYAGIGLSEQYRADPAFGLASGYSTLVGAQVRIPLAQDRGFSLWRYSQSRLIKLESAAEWRLLEARQSLRHAVETAYITYLEQVANAATSIAAAERAEQLVRDAEELVRLKVVPEYQLAPARLEAALRREEILAADQAIDAARVRLVQVLGTTPVTLTTNAGVLVEAVVRVHPPLAIASTSRRGALREIAALSEAAEAETRGLLERLRPDLSLSVRGVWATEETSSRGDSSSLVAGNASSTAAMLVWTRPWNETGPRARLRQAQARERELAELRHDLENRLAADQAAAAREFSGAQARLGEMTTAVDQARRTLESESERFRLGEGRSRNVLDAQNDLTKAYRSRNAIAASLLRGEADFRYASGTDCDEGAATAPDQGVHAGGHQ